MTGKQAIAAAIARCPHLHAFKAEKGLSREGTETFYISANQYPRGDYHILGSGDSWAAAIADIDAALTPKEV